MSTIKRIELINAINEYVLDNKTEPVVDILNRLLDNEVIKKDNLDLIFMGIATTPNGLQERRSTLPISQCCL